MKVMSEVFSSRLVRTVTRRFKRGKVTVFMLHRAAGIHPEIGGHDIDEIAGSLEVMRGAGIRFISLSDVVEAVQGRREIVGDSVAFTVDDGYSDQVDRVAPVFLGRSIPLSIFVITGLLDRLDWPWDAKISWIVRRSQRESLRLRLGEATLVFPLASASQKRSSRRELTQIYSGIPGSKLLYALEALQEAADVSLPAQIPLEYAPTAWGRLRELEQQGLTVAPHTVSHRIVSRLTGDEVRWEISESFRRVREELSLPLPVMAWPVGRERHYGKREMQLAAEAGIQISFAADGGYSDLLAARIMAGERHGLSRFAWPESPTTALRYATGIEAFRSAFAGRPNAGLPAWLPASSADNADSMRRRIRRRVVGGASKIRDLGRNSLGRSAFERARKVDWRDVTRLVFVCKGNVCRSAYAEGLARSFGFDSVSFGLDVDETNPADEEAIKTALMLGVDMTVHLSRPITQASLSRQDCLVAMEPEQLRRLQVLTDDFGCQATLLGLWARDATARVPDPFGQGRYEMVRVFRLIEDGLEGLLSARDDALGHPQ